MNIPELRRIFVHFQQLQGCRRCDPKNGGGKIAFGTEIENSAGTVAEA
jgi:hypothetical protein